MIITFIKKAKKIFKNMKASKTSVAVTMQVLYLLLTLSGTFFFISWAERGFPPEEQHTVQLVVVISLLNVISAICLPNVVKIWMYNDTRKTVGDATVLSLSNVFSLILVRSSKSNSESSKSLQFWFLISSFYSFFMLFFGFLTCICTCSVRRITTETIHTHECTVRRTHEEPNEVFIIGNTERISDANRQASRQPATTSQSYPQPPPPPSPRPPPPSYHEVMADALAAERERIKREKPELCN
jgi:hypothetical protein